MIANKIEHFDGLVFWAKDSFDQRPHGSFVRQRFNQLYDTYQNKMRDFEDTVEIDDRIRSELRIEQFFQTIVPIVNGMIVMAR